MRQLCSCLTSASFLKCMHINTVCMHSIGKSVNGVHIWVVEISDKAGKAEPEPNFRYIANMHGDEPSGR